MLIPLGSLSSEEYTCKDCWLFESLDDRIVTISYGFCKILKVAVDKDDKDFCKHFKKEDSKRDQGFAEMHKKSYGGSYERHNY